MKMGWFRMWSEARNDRKLSTLTDSQFRVWFNLLCIANESNDRGIIDADDLDLLSLEAANGDTELLESTIQRLVKLKILTDSDCGFYLFTAWERRQYDKPSDTPDAVKERVARHRAEKRNATVSPKPPVESTVSPCIAPKRDVTPGNAHTRGEEIEESRVEEIESVVGASGDEASAVDDKSQPPAPVKSPKKSTKKVQTDDEWLQSLKDSGAYDGINIETEIKKCTVHFQTKGFIPTRQRIVAWLNRVDKPFTPSLPFSQTTRGNPRPTEQERMDNMRSRLNDLQARGGSFASNIVNN